MTIDEIIMEIKWWKWTSYKIVNFAIGFLALLSYQFIGRPIYRPYIYANHIDDWHIADTLGNTFGTLTTIFLLVAIFSRDTDKGNYWIKYGTIMIVVYEIAQPLLGKPIDPWDIIATILTGMFSHVIYNFLFKNRKAGDSPL